MEQWKQMRQAGLVPLELGPPPRALRGVPPMERPGQAFVLPQTDTDGARERLLWIWEELGNLRRVDTQLLDQLCSLALEMGALRKELEEEEESSEEDEEGEEPQQKQEEEDLEPSCPATGLPDFEMTI
ncbi:glutamate-rich protein 4 [Loxodonta africana]|uniref:Glutamate rich 4 n=1 Tax=Loxodonta africana TaxID=9785 RepID=G3TN65_LOXAF|nr:glutamate-rich protein 4 [Loxodonta africana]